jgi:hypothetical protein
MLHIRETIHKTKLCFYKTLQTLKSFCYGKCQKLPKLPSFNPFSCGSGRRGSRKEYQIDQFYIKFCDEWEASLDKAKESYNTSLKASKEHKKEEEAEEEDACHGSFIKFSKQSPVKGNKQQGVEEEQKNKESPQIGKEEESCSKKTNQGGLVLAQKMKDLEMMETDDVEHVLDVEEALHYYSRLTSPLYVDIVDKFFRDMYTEFSAPQVSNSINTSERRFGSNSIRL